MVPAKALTPLDHRVREGFDEADLRLTRPIRRSGSAKETSHHPSADTAGEVPGDE